MRHKTGIIAGAAVAAITMALASQTGLFARNGAHTDSSPKTTATEAPQVAEAPQPALTPAAEAEIARLTMRLAEREAAYARALASLQGRDTENARLTELLAERDAELTELRNELDSLRAEVALASKAAEPAPTPDVTSAALTEASPAQALALRDGRPDRLTAVHFDPSSARLSPGGQAHAAAAAVMLSEMSISRIQVIGYTDRTGSPKRNRALAEARARAVADFLIRAGLPADTIDVVSKGEEDAPVTTGDGVTEPLNRCAEIVIVPL